MNTNIVRSVDWACGPNDMDDDTRKKRDYGGSHRDETKEAGMIVEEADQRRRIERRQGSDGTGGCRH